MDNFSWTLSNCYAICLNAVSLENGLILGEISAHRDEVSIKEGLIVAMMVKLRLIKLKFAL